MADVAVHPVVEADELPDGPADLLAKKELMKLPDKLVADCWYEWPLPKPPVPTLEHTLARYLEYAAVQAQTYDLDLERTAKCVEQFGQKIGQELQSELVKLAEQQDNWINGFWLPEMYLRQRAPLPLNFNPAYIFPRQHFHTEQDQLDYAAWLVRGFLDFKERVDKKQIARESVPDRFFHPQANVRMCMDQYERVLNFCRQPGQDEDILLDRRHVFREEEHILVLSQCQTFVLFTRWQGRPQLASQISRHLAKIRQMSRNRSGHVTLGAAGTGQRDRAGRFWTEMGREPVNRQSLEWVHSAVFVLCLDECADDNGQGLTGQQERDGHQILHGFGPARDGLNRWFDATIQLIVSRNGCCGLCIEHSVGEGIVYINMTEEVIRFADQSWAHQKKTVDCSPRALFCGQLQSGEEAEKSSRGPEPCPLSWAISEEAATLLRQQTAEFERLAQDIDLRVLDFDGFGKTAIKSWKVSPDGFVQLCMQLAHFKVHGCLVSTYESATLRRYRLGRVDNIRAATPEALAWVRAMAAEPVQGKTCRRALFGEAAAKQALLTRENVTGHGIDNHLCALEVLSRKFGPEQQPEMFRQRMWAELMRFPLTTSQVSTSPQFQGCYLCYGPVVRDGYGCAYNIQADRLIFAISAWKSDPRTNANNFLEKMRESLSEMRQILEED